MKQHWPLLGTFTAPFGTWFLEDAFVKLEARRRDHKYGKRKWTEMQKERDDRKGERKIHHFSSRVKAQLNSGSPDTERRLTSDYNDKWPLPSITHEENKTSRIAAVESLHKYKSISRDRKSKCEVSLFTIQHSVLIATQVKVQTSERF